MLQVGTGPLTNGGSEGREVEAGEKKLAVIG